MPESFNRVRRFTEIRSANYRSRPGVIETVHEYVGPDAVAHDLLEHDLEQVVAEHAALLAEVEKLRAERSSRAATGDAPPECPVCERTDVTLTKAGRMRSHSGDIWIGGFRQICKGVGELPRHAAPQQQAQDGSEQ